MNSIAVAANTFTPSYSAKEDRIHLVVNYDNFEQRVDFWITRSFLLKLLPMWEEYFYKHSAATDITIDSSQTSKNSNTSKTDIHTLELTKKKAILLTSVDMQFNHKKNRFKITMKGSNTEVFAYLSPQMMIGILRSIFHCVPHMHWGISPALLD